MSQDAAATVSLAIWEGASSAARAHQRPRATHEPGDRPDPSNSITVGDAGCLFFFPARRFCPAPTESCHDRFPERDERHLARMQRKKAVIDERIANSRTNAACCWC
jgi:hypothetical protein